MDGRSRQLLPSPGNEGWTEREELHLVGLVQLGRSTLQRATPDITAPRLRRMRGWRFGWRRVWDRPMLGHRPQLRRRVPRGPLRRPADGCGPAVALQAPRAVGFEPDLPGITTPERRRCHNGSTSCVDEA